MLAFINGQPHSSQTHKGLSLLDRGLAYGDGLFETMLLSDGKVALWPFHHRRLLKGLDTLGITLESSDLHQHLLTVYRHPELSAGRHIHKLIVTRGDAGRGYCPDSLPSPKIISLVFPLEITANREGLKAHICRQKLYPNPPLAGLKTLNQLPYVLASQERMDTDYDEGLLFSDNGCLIEATARNIFLVVAGHLMTPKLHQCGVAGVMRQWIMEQLAPQNNLQVVEDNISLEKFKSADEVFLCNSIQGIWPLTQCVQFQHPNTDNIQEELTQKELAQTHIYTWPVGKITQLLQASLEKELHS